MEQNLTRALLMAAGMLVAILILALGSYLYYSFAARVENVKAQNKIVAIQTYNSYFTKYDGRVDLTIQDIVSVTNLVREYNIKNEVVGISNMDDKGNYYITVNVNNVAGISNLQNLETDNNYTHWNKYFSLLENDQLSKTTFKCEITAYDNEGRVKKIDFKA